MPKRAVSHPSSPFRRVMAHFLRIQLPRLSAALPALVAYALIVQTLPARAATYRNAMASLPEGVDARPLLLGPVGEPFPSRTPASFFPAGELSAGVPLPPANETFSEAGEHENFSEYFGDAANQHDRNFYDRQPYRWQLMPQGLIYRQYLAGVKESRLRGVWNSQSDGGNIWDVSLGGQVGLLRYGSYRNGRPIGWQLGLEGSGQVRLDKDENLDVDAADFRVGVPITWGNEISQVKFAFYHLSSHLGDEFLLKTPGFPRLNFSRNVLVLGYSIYPAARWRVYAEIGYALTADVSKEWETQFGVEFAPAGATGPRGAPFAAANAHLREEVDFGGNFVCQLGWAWRGSPASGMFRTGVEYYNGKSEQFSFYDESEQKLGFGMWYDY